MYVYDTWLPPPLPTDTWLGPLVGFGVGAAVMLFLLLLDRGKHTP